MTARDPDPIQPKLCPKCKGPAREATRSEYVAGKPFVCDPCDLFFTGSQSEFNRYRSRDIVAAAERMTTSPSTQPRPETGSDQE